MRFGQNAVKTPGRTHKNYCVTKGIKEPLGSAPDCLRRGCCQAAAFCASHLWVAALGSGCGRWLNGVCPSGGPPFCRGRKEAKSAQGASPWTPGNGQRTPAYGLQSNPPPCLSRVVRSTVVSAERFLARPLGMGFGGGGNNGNLAFCSHLTPSGRFRPPLSWPYSVIFSAEKIEPFGLAPLRGCCGL